MVLKPNWNTHNKKLIILIIGSLNGHSIPNVPNNVECVWEFSKPSGYISCWSPILCIMLARSAFPRWYWRSFLTIYRPQVMHSKVGKWNARMMWKVVFFRVQNSCSLSTLFWLGAENWGNHINLRCYKLDIQQKIRKGGFKIILY